MTRDEGFSLVHLCAQLMRWEAVMYMPVHTACRADCLRITRRTT